MKKIIITALVVGGIAYALVWARQVDAEVNVTGQQTLVLWDKTEALIDQAPRGTVPRSCSTARSHAATLRNLMAEKYKTTEKMEAGRALANQAKVCVTELIAANK